MAASAIERWKGIEFKIENRRIVRARFKRGFPQVWHLIPARHYGSKQECLAYKETEKLSADPEQVPNSKVTFGEYAMQVLAEKNSLAPSTINNYRFRLQSDWIKPLWPKRLVQINGEHIEALVRRQKQRLEAEGKPLVRATVESYLTPVQMVFSHAIQKRDYRDVNPVTAVSMKDLARPKQKQPILVLTGEPLARLFAALGDEYLCLFALAYYTGARISELLGLRWEHINMKEENPLRNWVFYEGQLDPRSGEWRIGTKGRKEETPRGREVDLPPAALPYLRKQLALVGLNRRPTDPVFPGLNQRKVQGYIRGSNKGRKHYPGLRERLGPDFDGTGQWAPFTMHKLRHTYGSLLVEWGLPLAYVAAQMGNTIDVLTSTYAKEIARVQRDPNRSAAAAMNHEVEAVR